MNKEKIERLENLKQKYLSLKNEIINYKYLLENINNLDEEKNKVKEDVKVKKLVLTKPFYGKNLIVG